MLQQILNILNYAAVHVPWSAVAASGVLSPLLVAVKKWFSVQSERVMITLVALSSGLVVAGNYLLHVPTHDPSIIAVQTAVVAFMTQPVYFFMVKPGLAAIQKRIADYNAQVLAAGTAPTVAPGLAPSDTPAPTPAVVAPTSTSIPVDFSS